MSVLIVHLSDLHAYGTDNPIAGKSTQLAQAVVAEASSKPSDIVLLFAGDAAQSGVSAEFEVARALLLGVRDQISSNCPGARVHLLLVPGNHDCDLSGDQAARDCLLQNITEPTTPASSFVENAIVPLQTFFGFSESVASPDSSLSTKTPFYRMVDLPIGTYVLRFHLLNTAWMSSRREKANTLVFPIDLIGQGCSIEPTYSIAVLHHPFNWFRQPDVMRPLRDKIEDVSDLILTGHEHTPSIHQKRIGMASQPSRINGYLEGGVIQSRDDPEDSSFHIVHLDFASRRQRISTYSWTKAGYYGRSVEGDVECLGTNVGRVDRRFALKLDFQQFLDDPELPLGDSKTSGVRLTDFFTYPDLRRVDEGSAPGNWKRVKAEDVLTTVQGTDKLLITGAERSGKTSLAKTLFQDLHRAGKVPILLNGGELRSVTSPEACRKAISKALGRQYERLKPEQFEQQCQQEQRVLILDDLQSVSRPEVLEYAESVFGKLLLIASEEYCFEEFHRHSSEPSLLTTFERYDICEFGQLRLAALTANWLRLGSVSNEEDRLAIQQEVERVCKLIEQALKTNAIPHYPWILIVLLKQLESSDQPAAKNGSYGHLYNALITAALATSAFKRLDIKGKYTYLASFAFFLFRGEQGTVSDEDMQVFHKNHCDLFDITLDYEPLRDDFIRAGILRCDHGQIAFRAKYTYCFFLAWYLTHHIHQEDVRSIVRQLTQRLYHEESSNTIVFLAHLSNDPIVLTEMKRTALALFSKIAPTDLDNDVEFLDELTGPLAFSLPASRPEENRRQAMDAEDEERIKRTSDRYDGRQLSTHPEQSVDDERLRFHYELRSARKTIQILGQVLRNEAAAIEGNEKHEIVKAIYLLGRRLIGSFLKDYAEVCPTLVDAFRELFRETMADDDARPYKTSKQRSAGERSAEEARKMAFGMGLFVVFAVIKHLSESVGLDLLGTTFRRILEEEKPAPIPTRIIDLSVAFDSGKSLPKDKAVALHRDLHSKVFSQTLVQLLVLHHLYLYDVGQSDMQSLCSKLNIKIPRGTLDPTRKRLDAIRK